VNPVQCNQRAESRAASSSAAAPAKSSIAPEYDRRGHNPEQHGFEFAGYVVRLPDGRYVQHWNIFVPNAGFVVTSDANRAGVYETKKVAEYLAKQVRGTVAAKYLSRTEVMVRW